MLNMMPIPTGNPYMAPSMNPMPFAGVPGMQAPTAYQTNPMTGQPNMASWSYPPTSSTSLGTLPPMQSPGVQSGLFGGNQTSTYGSPPPPVYTPPTAAGGMTPGGANPFSGVPSLAGMPSAPTGTPPNPFVDQLTQMLQSGGNPINQTAPWQAMIDAQQRNIQENAAQLAEQFNVSGNRTSTGFGTAMTDYYNQANLQQNALLGQMTATAGENAANRLFGTQSQLSGQDFQSMMDQYNTANQAAMGMYQSQMGTVAPFLNYGLGLQGLGVQGGTNLGDLYNQTWQTGGMLGGQQYQQGQNAISNAYQEFLRTQPYNNPLMQMMYSGAFNYPQMITPGYQPGMLGSMMQGAGGILGGIGALAPLLAL